MSFITPKRDHDTTAFAYQTTWATLRIINLTAQKANRLSAARNITDSVDFKAFIRTFRDTFNAGWQETQYPNQSVPIAHQSMPKRSITLAWTLPAASEAEAIINMQKCSFLAQSMFPSLKFQTQSSKYTPRSTFMAIKFANLIQNNDGGPLPGYISNFTYTPNFTEGVFISGGSPNPPIFGPNPPNPVFATPNQNQLIPKIVDITLEFKPIQARDEFGFLEHGDNKTGWSYSAWPYDVKMDPRLRATVKGDVSFMPADLSPNRALDHVIKAAEKKVTG